MTSFSAIRPVVPSRRAARLVPSLTSVVTFVAALLPAPSHGREMASSVSTSPSITDGSPPANQLRRYSPSLKICRPAPRWTSSAAMMASSSFCAPQCLVAQIASVVRRSRLQKLRRPQQTADVIGVQRHVSPLGPASLPRDAVPVNLDAAMSNVQHECMEEGMLGALGMHRTVSADLTWAQRAFARTSSRVSWSPAHRLRQVELAQRFGVSTTPVREALAALQSEGLVRLHPQRGAVVFAPTVEGLREHYEIRAALEALAAERAAERFDPTRGEQLAAMLDEPWRPGPASSGTSSSPAVPLGAVRARRPPAPRGHDRDAARRVQRLPAHLREGRLPVRAARRRAPGDPRRLPGGRRERAAGAVRHHLRQTVEHVARRLESDAR